MSFTIPDYEPTKFTAGDSLDWRRSFSDYSAVDYTLTYYFRGPKNWQAVATSEGSIFRITKTASDTADLLPGTYYWQAKVSAGSEVRTVLEGQIEVKKNLSAVTDTGFDGRSRARKALDLIDAVLAMEAEHREEEYTIDGVIVRGKDVAKLLQLRDHYKSLVAQEDSAQNIENGRPGRKKIMHRFTR